MFFILSYVILEYRVYGYLNIALLYVIIKHAVKKQTNTQTRFFLPKITKENIDTAKYLLKNAVYSKIN